MCIRDSLPCKDDADINSIDADRPGPSDIIEKMNSPAFRSSTPQDHLVQAGKRRTRTSLEAFFERERLCWLENYSNSEKFCSSSSYSTCGCGMQINVYTKCDDIQKLVALKGAEVKIIINVMRSSNEILKFYAEIRTTQCSEFCWKGRVLLVDVDLMGDYVGYLKELSGKLAMLGVRDYPRIVVLSSFYDEAFQPPICDAMIIKPMDNECLRQLISAWFADSAFQS
eukprot:TRINITY_DN3845_c0_g1_i9.p1 TRINITY_DN3845_c0_g1~~TRINITY_DN3845_c0_g1_i9.p1  ORF type:complete len:226 (-),score=18.37 TRINITY_DN3845_c0_g1_i9:405-1082(-)